MDSGSPVVFHFSDRGWACSARLAGSGRWVFSREGTVVLSILPDDLRPLVRRVDCGAPLRIFLLRWRRSEPEGVFLVPADALVALRAALGLPAALP